MSKIYQAFVELTSTPEKIMAALEVELEQPKGRVDTEKCIDLLNAYCSIKTFPHSRAWSEDFVMVASKAAVQDLAPVINWILQMNFAHCFLTTDKSTQETPIFALLRNGREDMACAILSDSMYISTAVEKLAAEKGMTRLGEILCNTQGKDISDKRLDQVISLKRIARENGHAETAAMYESRQLTMAVQRDNAKEAAEKKRRAALGNELLIQLSYVEEAYKPEKCHALIAEGADLAVRNGRNQTPLICAAFGGHASVAIELIGMGVPLDEKDDRGMTALHWACRWCMPRTIEALLKAGANTELLDNDGLTPIGNARDQGHLPSVMDIFVACGKMEPTTIPQMKKQPFPGAKASKSTAP